MRRTWPISREVSSPLRTTCRISSRRRRYSSVSRSLMDPSIRAPSYRRSPPGPASSSASFVSSSSTLACAVMSMSRSNAFSLSRSPTCADTSTGPTRASHCRRATRAACRGLPARCGDDRQASGRKDRAAREEAVEEAGVARDGGATQHGIADCPDARQAEHGERRGDEQPHKRGGQNFGCPPAAVMACHPPTVGRPASRVMRTNEQFSNGMPDRRPNEQVESTRRPGEAPMSQARVQLTAPSARRAARDP